MLLVLQCRVQHNRKTTRARLSRLPLSCCLIARSSCMLPTLMLMSGWSS